MSEQFNAVPDLDLGHQMAAYLSTNREWLDIQLNNEINNSAESIAFTVDQACKLRDWLIAVCPRR